MSADYSRIYAPESVRVRAFAYTDDDLFAEQMRLWRALNPTATVEQASEAAQRIRMELA